MNELDENTLRSLIKEGVSPANLRKLPTQGLPSNTAGIPALLAYETPELQGTNVQGFVVSNPRLDQRENNRAAASALFVAPKADPATFAHEAEHLMAKRQLGFASSINQKFDELINDPKARGTFVKAAMDAAPYLKEKYGLENAYFSPEILRRNEAPVLVYEQLASLASVEQTLGVDLTKDPVLRKTLFKDPAVRETYNALTGLRQTRLDPRDIAPYTRVPEKKPEDQAQSLLQKVKQSLRLSQGGEAKLI